MALDPKFMSSKIIGGAVDNTTPADYDNMRIWIPTSYSQYLWTGAIDASPNCGIGSGVLNHSELGSYTGNFFGLNSTWYPILAESTGNNQTRIGLDFIDRTTNKAMRIPDTSSLNHFHNDGSGCILMNIKFRPYVATNEEALLDSTEATSGKQGISLRRTWNNKLEFGLTNGAGWLVLIETTGLMTDTDNWHTIKVKVDGTGANGVSLTVDDGQASEEVVLGTLSAVATGDSTNIPYLGLRSNGFSSVFGGIISDLVIFDRIPSAANEAHWDTFNKTFQV